MKKILIPIDLTAASLNAVVYAIGLGNHSQVEHIILTANSHLSAFEQLYPSPDYLPASAETQTEREDILQRNFSEIKGYIADHLTTTITLSLKISRSPLIEGLADVMFSESPDLMVLGVDFANGLIGDHLIDIAKASTIPVLIIPEKATYQTVQTALVPYNITNVLHLGLLNTSHIFDAYPRPELFLLKVKDNDTQHSQQFDDSYFHDILKDFSYAVFDAINQGIMASLAQFVTENEVQLIVALPGEHGFLYRLTHHSITAELAKTNHLPILILQP